MHWLIHFINTTWGLNKMAGILQTTFSFSHWEWLSHYLVGLVQDRGSISDELDGTPLIDMVQL